MFARLPVYASTCVRVHMCTCAHVSLCMGVCVRMYVCICTCKCLSACADACAYVLLRMYTYAHRLFTYVLLCTLRGRFNYFLWRPLIYVPTYIRTYVHRCVRKSSLMHIHTYMCTYARARTYARSHAGFCLSTYVPMRIHTMHAHSIQVRAFALMCVLTCTCAYTCIHIREHTHSPVRVYVRTYVHMYVRPKTREVTAMQTHVHRSNAKHLHACSCGHKDDTCSHAIGKDKHMLFRGHRSNNCADVMRLATVSTCIAQRP